jgi:hypothetical protein
LVCTASIDPFLDALDHSPLTGAAATLGVIFRIFGGAYLEQYGTQVSDEQRRVLQLIALCRTSVLGVAHWECEQCGHVHELYNPCRDRHCGSCGHHAARQWQAAHRAELLPLPYYAQTAEMCSRAAQLGDYRTVGTG